MPRRTDRRERRDRAGGTAVAPSDKHSLKRDTRRPARTPTLIQQWPLLVGLTSVLAVLLAGVAIVLSLLSVSVTGRVSPIGSQSPAGATSVTVAGAPGQDPRVLATPSGPGLPVAIDRRTKGRADAPVVITEWFDFQCPACGRFALTSEPEIDRLYVQTGKVRYIFRNLAFLGPESVYAAEAAEAAAAQGRYWDFAKMVFSQQNGENRGAFSPDNLKRFASALGLDMKAFNDALDRGVYREAILAEKKEGDAAGIKATPSFLINGRLLPNVPSVDSLGKLIDEEAAKKP